MIQVLEVIRAGDIFLFKVTCPACSEKTLTSSKAMYCDCGLTDLTPVFDISLADKRVLAYNVKNNSRKKISKKIVRFLYDMQEGLCAYCSKKLDNYHVDHIYPLAAGGTNDISNLAISCPTCNLTASSFCFPDLAAKRNYILSKRFKIV